MLTDPSFSPSARSPLLSGPFLAMLVSSVALFSGFALLVSVVPLWLTGAGAGEFAAGAATGVFMTTTVLAQLLMTGLVSRYGYRLMSIVGALLLGVPAALLPLSAAVAPVLMISAVRGVGFGIVTVCGSALVAELLPVGSHGRGAAAYGVAVGLPLLAALPLSAWLAQQVSFTLVFVLGAALPVLAIVPLLWLPRHERAVELPSGSTGSVQAVVRPWLAMLSGSIAFGAMVTFLPLVFLQSAAAGALALLVMSATALAGRWVAGAWTDRSSSPRLVVLTGLAALGVALLGFAASTELASGTSWLGLLSVALYGAGFGLVQNSTLVAMFARTTAARASVAWNVAFDAGQGLGAVAVGALVAVTNYAVAFGCLGVFALVLLPAMLRER